MLRAAFLFLRQFCAGLRNVNPIGGEGETMRRTAILALMLVAVLVPLVGIVHADLKSDQVLQQAP